MGGRVIGCESMVEKVWERWRVDIFGVLRCAQDERGKLLQQCLQSLSWRRAERFPLWVFSLVSAVGRSRLSLCMTMAVFTLPDFSRRAAATGWSMLVAAIKMRWARSMSLALEGWTLTMRLP